MLDAKMRMGSALKHLLEVFRGITACRAHPSLLEPIPVNYHGSPTPLGHLDSRRSAGRLTLLEDETRAVEALIEDLTQAYIQKVDAALSAKVRSVRGDDTRFELNGNDRWRRQLKGGKK